MRVFVHPEFSIEFGRDLASTFYCQDWCKIATKLTIKMVFACLRIRTDTKVVIKPWYARSIDGQQRLCDVYN